MRGMGQNAYNEMLLHAREANQSPVYIIDPKSKSKAEWKEKWKQRKKQEGRRKERN
jgi:hypothetical protein